MRVTPLTKRDHCTAATWRQWGRALAVGVGLTTVMMTAAAGSAQETGGIGAPGRVDAVETADQSSPGAALTGIGASGIVTESGTDAMATGIGAAGIVTDSAGAATLPATTERDTAAASMQAMPDTGVGSMAETSAAAAALAAIGAAGALAVAMRQRQAGPR